MQFAAIQVGEFFIPLRTCISCVGSSLRASRLETIVSLCGQACQQTQVLNISLCVTTFKEHTILKFVAGKVGVSTVIFSLC